VAVIVDDGHGFVSIEDVEGDVPRICVETVLPQLGNGGRSIGNLLAAEMVDRSRLRLKRNGIDHAASACCACGAAF
jgi:hypothetical protein